VTARSHKGQRLHDGQAGEDGPDKVAECDSSLGALAENTPVAVRDANMSSQGGSTGEPEEGSEGEDAESDHAMVHARCEDGREGEVEQHDDGPDDTEEQERILGRRAAAPPAGVGRIYEVCGEAQLDDEEESQNGVDDGDNSHSHDDDVDAGSNSNVNLLE